MHEQRRLMVGVASNVNNLYGRQVMLGILRYANLQRHWQLVEEFNIEALDPASWPRCDGAVVITADCGLLEKLRARCGHVVCCSGETDPALLPVVTIDNVQVGNLAARHLLDCGLKHFAFVGGHLARVGGRRLAGFRHGVEAQGFTCAVSPVSYDQRLMDYTSARAHWPALIAWLASLPKPVGILTMDDRVGHDLAAACQHAKITVPDSVAIVGVNNDELLCLGSFPPISSVEADSARVGYMGATLLARLMAGEVLPPERRLIELPPHEVVRRASSDVLAVEDEKVAEALRFIREHACDPCTVRQVLEHVPLNQRDLELRFLRNIGRKPLQEIIRVRLERARRLLVDSELSLREIAEQCGFESQHSFQRAFRRVTQETPGAYARVRRKFAGGNGAPPVSDPVD